jgi:hypothetical protein
MQRRHVILAERDLSRTQQRGQALVQVIVTAWV